MFVIIAQAASIIVYAATVEGVSVLTANYKPNFSYI
jgi:hypothetical protein